MNPQPPELVEMSGWNPIHLGVNLEVDKTMTEPKVTTEKVVELLRQLPPRERLRAVARILLENVLPEPTSEPRPSLRGLWRGLNITDEDIEEVRREMWGRFPPEDV